MKKNKLMLLLICTLLSLSLVIGLSSNANVKAYVIDYEIDDNIESGEGLSKLNYLNNPIKEEKSICKATIEDNFTDDMVIVVLTHKASLKGASFDQLLKQGEIKEDLTKYKYGKINSDYNRYISESMSGINKNADKYSDQYEIAVREAQDNLEEEYPYYHRIFSIQLKTKGKEGVLERIKEIEKNDEVLYACPNYIYKVDSFNALDTEEKAEGFDIATDENNQEIAETGSGNDKALVGILDSGVSSTHPKLQGNIDLTLGHDFTQDNSPHTDITGHGTMVAGVVGDVYGNNAFSKIKLVSLKIVYFLKDSNGNYLYDSQGDQLLGFNHNQIAAAIDYAGNHNIRVLNCSNNFSDTTDDHPIIDALNNYNGIFICAAGNGNKGIYQGLNIDNANSGLNYRYPSLYTVNNIISVASVNSNSKKSSFSNYGTTSVDIAAPGENIKTTSKYGGYVTGAWGTSFSAPKVARTAAKIVYNYPTINYYGLRKAILDSADKINNLSGYVAYKRLLNENAAVTFASQQKFSFRYVANGGTGNQMTDTVVTYGVPTPLSNCTYTRTGYKFKGWYAYRTSDQKWKYKNYSTGGHKWFGANDTIPTGYVRHLFESGYSFSITSSVKNDVIKLYAQWEPIEYHISFNGGGPQEVHNVTVTYNNNYTLPENMFLREDQMFNGWQVQKHGTDLYLYTDGNWYSDINPPANQNIIKKVYYEGDVISNLTNQDGEFLIFRVQWLNLYSINYDSNGGSGYMDFTPAVSQTPIQLRPNTFVKQNYIFLGWYLQDDNYQWSTTYNNEWLSNIPNGYEIKLYDDCDTVIYDSYCDVTAFAQWGLLGDADLDESLTIMDATKIQRYLAGLDTFSTIQEKVADFDQDGDITIMDALTIQIYLSNQ